jgi:thiol:disulfide interchange protein DsbD
MVWFWIFGILTGMGEVPLQYPPVTIGLAAILFVLSLSLFGVYEILLPGSATGKLDEAASHEGYLGAFWNGFLATLLGTACTAPFFAGAAAYAATQPRQIALLIFTSAGLGMSTPYLLLSGFPGWLKKLPRPGPWMVTFKQVMGFVIIATVVWLLKVIGAQVGISGLIWTLAFLTFLAFSVWLIGRIRPSWTSGPRYATWASAVAVTVFGFWFSLLHMYDLRSNAAGAAGDHAPAMGGTNGDSIGTIVERVRKSDWNGEIPWQPFRPGLAEELSSAGYTVYVDYTADWCVNCKTNLYTSLEIASTRKRMQELGIIPVVADYTNRSRAIREDLLRFGFNGVPMNLVYPAGKPKDVIVLPVLFTPGIVQEALQKAGPSRDVSAQRGTADQPGNRA